MSAETLRRAAALMRERAEAATAGPWSVGSRTCEIRGNGGRNYVGSTYGGILGVEEPNAEHIASWHPVVALAVADWLDYLAGAHDDTPCPAFTAAVPIARAYLGESA